MAENGRHGLVGPVISSFSTIMAAHRLGPLASIPQQILSRMFQANAERRFFLFTAQLHRAMFKSGG